MNWAPEDYAVLLLALTVAVMGIGSITRSLIMREPPSDSAMKIIATVVSAILAIISLYVGAKVGGCPPIPTSTTP